MVPEYLKNRPQNFVNHCLRRLSTAEEISQNDVISLDSVSGLFRIKSRLSSEWYNVSFGDTNRMPTCSCQDWQSSFMPCKHFLSVMRLYPEWSWHRLPSQYLDSPFSTPIMMSAQKSSINLPKILSVMVERCLKCLKM